MEITGLHLLLTYRCTLECDHCFVWGSPEQSGTMTLRDIRTILDQAAELDEVRWIYFEGGEPFLYHPVLVEGVRLAFARGYQVGIVSNAYWATSAEDAEAWLAPMADCISDLSLSSDLFHASDPSSAEVHNAVTAAGVLGIPAATITVVGPDAVCGAAAGQLPHGDSTVMYRGRAAAKLAATAPSRPWETFIECPYEDLRNPGRVHIDPFGWVHLCQGIALGNVSRSPLRAIFAAYVPDTHPIVGPLLAGGPAELARRHALAAAPGYADACHLCYHARCSLRAVYPEILGPDQMYGNGRL